MCKKKKTTHTHKMQRFSWNVQGFRFFYSFSWCVQVIKRGMNLYIILWLMEDLYILSFGEIDREVWYKKERNWSQNSVNVKTWTGGLLFVRRLWENQTSNFMKLVAACAWEESFKHWSRHESRGGYTNDFTFHWVKKNTKLIYFKIQDMVLIVIKDS